MAQDGDKRLSLEELREELLKQFRFEAKDLLTSSDALSQYANQVNRFFTQGRQRITELSVALADATPGVRRLGGDIADVADVIGRVAQESRRNVIANTEDVEKLFAATKVLELGADTLTKSFLDVGVGIERIPKTLEESVTYVQSIGGNAKMVMQDVTRNMDQMNRFQFEGGVLGLTKMAAQASMLRFDMNETFRLADRVLSPEGAIETAAAFQRLGVMSGNLADPFALMNASINDPGALQDSLVDVAKQFTYFDEKTKTFKINPQGVLTLREMERETGISAREMTKLGLAAAEADKRISAIGAAGLNIKEDDKQYIANIARMGEGGEYEVKLRDESGIEQTRKLTEITQDEFDNLIKVQREQPKTMEEIARSQMSTTQLILSDVSAIRASLIGGIVSSGQIVENVEGARRGLTTISGEASTMMGAQNVRKETERAFMDISSFMDQLKDKNIDIVTALENYLEKVGEQTGGIEESFKNSMEKSAENIRKNLGDRTAIERTMKEGVNYVLDKIESNQTSQIQQQQGQISNNRKITSLIEGTNPQFANAYGEITKRETESNSRLEITGAAKFDFNFNGDPSFITPEGKQTVTKIVVDTMNSLQYSLYTKNNSKAENPLRANTQSVLPNVLT
jgi:hypothetical protein